jgi:hypothetical protein
MIEDSSEKIISQKKFVVRKMQNLTREREQLRKADTRHKIQLGGLIIKAGLDQESSSILLGLLCDAKERLSAERDRWRMIGDKEFSVII